MGLSTVACQSCSGVSPGLRAGLWAWTGPRTARGLPLDHAAPKGGHNLGERDHGPAGSLTYLGPDHPLNQVDLVGLREMWGTEPMAGKPPYLPAVRSVFLMPKAAI